MSPVIRRIRNHPPMLSQERLWPVIELLFLWLYIYVVGMIRLVVWLIWRVYNTEHVTKGYRGSLKHFLPFVFVDTLHEKAELGNAVAMTNKKTCSFGLYLSCKYFSAQASHGTTVPSNPRVFGHSWRGWSSLSLLVLPACLNCCLVILLF